jgi:hypothetical protein
MAANTTTQGFREKVSLFRFTRADISSIIQIQSQGG